MKKRKPKGRMGRPPMPIDKVRPHKYKVSLTHRDQHLLEKFNKELRPDLSPASYIRHLAHQVLEIMDDQEQGLAEMLAEQVHVEAVKAGAIQKELDFAQGEVHTAAFKTLRKYLPKMERMVNDALPMKIKNPDTVLHFKD